MFYAGGSDDDKSASQGKRRTTVMDYFNDKPQYVSNDESDRDREGKDGVEIVSV